MKWLAIAAMLVLPAYVLKPVSESAPRITDAGSHETSVRPVRMLEF